MQVGEERRQSRPWQVGECDMHGVDGGRHGERRLFVDQFEPLQRDRVAALGRVDRPRRLCAEAYQCDLRNSDTPIA